MKEQMKKVGHVQFGYKLAYRKWDFAVTPKNHILMSCRGGLKQAEKVAKVLAASVKRNPKREGLDKVDGLARAGIANLVR